MEDNHPLLHHMPKKSPLGSTKQKKKIKRRKIERMKRKRKISIIIIVIIKIITKLIIILK